jgi:hypothetical protein
MRCCPDRLRALLVLAMLLATPHVGVCETYFSLAEEEAEPAADFGSPCACQPACDCCEPTFDCCDCYNGRHRLLGLFLPSDHCFDRFISPISNPFFFEDPRSLTEVRGTFIDNSLPNQISGGDAQVWNAQVRGRVTDRFSVIAQRLGYLQVNQAAGGGPQGFLSAPVGVKYNFYRDVASQRVASIGATYFIPSTLGPDFQIPSDGDFHFFLSGGAQIYDRGHWVSGTGFRLPSNNNWGTQLWYWSNQWDYEVKDGIYGLFGINWFHWMRSANLNSGSNVTGLDLINIPVSGVAGNNVVSAVVGAKWKPNPHLELGSGFEFPLTDRTDILHNRLYIDAIIRY